MSDRGGLTRDVTLRIRAQNQASQDLKTIASSVDSLTTSLNKQVQALSRADIKEKEFTATLGKLEKQATAIQGVAVNIDRFKDFDNVIRRASSAVEAAQAKLDQYRAGLAASGNTSVEAAEKTKQLETRVRDATARYDEQVRKQNELGEALRRVGVDTNDLAGAMARIKDLATQVGTSITIVTEAKTNYLEITRRVTAANEAEAAATKKAADAARDHAAALQREFSGAVGAAEKQHNAAVAAAKAESDAREKVAAEAAARKQAIEKESSDALEAMVVDSIHREDEVRQQSTERSIRAYYDKRAAAQASIKAEEAARAEADNRARAREIEAQSRFQRFLAMRRGGYKQETDEIKRQADAIRSVDETVRRTDAKGKVGAGEGAAKTVFGFKPYELTNIGYQFNDVFSGLANGQSILQILTQQGGQFIQIFGLKLLRLGPPLVVAIAAITVALEALHKAMRETASTREFDAILTANASAIGYTKEGLTDLRKEIEKFGVSWADAGKVIKSGIEGNIRGDRLQQFGRLAKDISIVLGKDVPNAMQELVRGFSEGEKGIFRLNNAYHFLDDSSANRIRQLFAERRDQEALSLALDKFSAKQREAAIAGTSPFAEAVLKLTNAWNKLIETLSKSDVVVGLIGIFEKLVGLIDRGANALDRYVENLKKLPSRGTPEQESMELQAGGVMVSADQLKKIRAAPTTPATSLPTNTSVLPEGSRFDNPQGLKLDGDTLNQLARIIAEGSKALPPGYKVEAISTSRPGDVVAGTNQPSEHGFDRAIDVQIVDPSGKIVPGAMGTGGPLYTQLDKAVEEAARKIAAGVAIAIGTTFSRKPDAGHYSLGGREAVANEARRGTLAATAATSAPGAAVQTGPTDEEKDKGKEAVRDAKDQYDIAHARNVEEEKAAERRKAILEAQQKTQDKAAQIQLINIHMREVEEKLAREQSVRDSEDRRQKVDDARHYNEIRAAGDKAEAAAVARGEAGYRALREARKLGEGEERDRLNRLDSENDRLQALKNTLSGLQKGLEGKNALDLAKALAAVDEQFDPIYASWKKVQEQATASTKAQVDGLKDVIDKLKEQYQAQARIEGLLSQAKAGASTREALISAADALRESGAISIQEHEDKVKAAFDLTSDSIKKTTKELQELIDTDKNLSPEKVALYTAEIEKLNAQAKYVSPFMKGLSKTIEDSFTNRGAEAFDTIAESIGGVIAKTKEWKDVWVSLKSAAANFFAGVLKDLAQYIIKAELAKLASSFASSFGGGAAGAAGSAASAAAAGTASQIGAVGASTGMSAGWASILSGAAAVIHEGGIVGQTQLPRRDVPGSWFDRAPRYHNGGMVGLAANEQATILQRGEEVLTSDNPRHIRNWGGGGGGGQPDINIRNVLVADPDLVPSHMASSRGEKIIMSTLTRNAATVRQLVR